MKETKSKPKRVVVINCAARYYNLGASKLFNYFLAGGDGEDVEVKYYNGDPGLWEPPATVDLVCLSVIFSWHAPLALEIALRYKPYADVWCGGPGMLNLKRWWTQHTGGLTRHRGLDPMSVKLRKLKVVE